MTRIVIASALCILLSTCHDNSVSVTTSPEFYPLAVGNSWKFLGPVGVVGGDSTFTEFVERDSTINGRRWSLVVSIHQNLRQQGLYSNSNIGYILHTGFGNDSILIYKYPTFSSDAFVSFQSNDTILVAADNAIVTTPAGTFTCIVYQRRTVFRDSTSVQTWYDNTYVARGYGKIRGELFSYDNHGIKQDFGSYQLIQYSIH